MSSADPLTGQSPTMTIRVVQWTTGNVGTCAVKAIAEHPDLQLVGCYGWSPAKVGRDVGDLCGIEPLGVVISDDIDALLDLAPDVVSYSTLVPDWDLVCRMLRAGINVVTTAAFIDGTSLGDETRRAIHDAAVAGRASIYGTGTNPGFANAFGLFVTQLCRTVRHVSVTESVDASFYDSVQTWEELGLGRPAGDPEVHGMAERVTCVFQDALAVMADGLGIELEEMVFSSEWAVTTADVDLGWWQIPHGHYCGLKATWSGRRGGQSWIDLNVVWTLGASMAPAWTLQHGYVVQVAGEPPVTATVQPGVVSGWQISDYVFITAMPAIHAIPAVVAAAPGILRPGDLPIVTARHRMTGPRGG